MKWKDSKNRYPLLIRGARQVGKTYLIEYFGKTAFDSLFCVNFEAQPEAIACFNSLDPDEILLRLQKILGQTIEIGKTLLFLDEIQACPKAILSLRYFKEKLPNLHIIGAGSLLDFTLIEGKFSFPVGRIQFMYLKPFSFQEYVNARKKMNTFDEIVKKSMNLSVDMTLHNEMIKLVREYFLVGGMPAAVSNFCSSLSLNETNKIHEILLSTYIADFSKYSTSANQKYLKIIFSGIFQIIGEQFKYSKIDFHFRSRELKQALNHLEWAGLIYPIYASSASGFPLLAKIKLSYFKTIFLDIGLMQHALKIDPEIIFQKDLVLINQGMIAEQFVGQEILAYTNPFQEGQLFYWQREKKNSSSEIDYIYTFFDIKNWKIILSCNLNLL